MRNKFDRQLQILEEQLIHMGELCESAIANATKALSDGSIEQAKAVINADAEIDEMEKDIEKLCLKLLLQQQPVAKDLRRISAALKMITDMERIGDQTADIAEIVISANTEESVDIKDIGRMASVVSKMVRDSVTSYVQKDLELARQVMLEDDKVDRLFDDIREEMVNYIAINKGQRGSRIVDLIMVTKYLERIGDHATNIAEWVGISITGVHRNGSECISVKRRKDMIYCVEDDDNIRELVIYTLETTGLKAKGFAEGTAFMEALAFDTPELILLDIMLPGEDGLELLKKLKNSAKTKDIPVIMVTAKGAEYDKVIGLDSGADDYVTKPFGMMELVSRIKAVLRRSGRVQEQDMLSVNGVSVDVKKHEVKVAGEIVTLTLKEFELLERLMRNQNIVLTRDQLLEDIWGYDFDGETRTVDVHVRTLRQKLGEKGDIIKTVRGVGYRIGGGNEG